MLNNHVLIENVTISIPYHSWCLFKARRFRTGLGVKGLSSSWTDWQLTGSRGSQGSESSIGQSVEECTLLKPKQLSRVPSGSEAATEPLDCIW